MLLSQWDDLLLYNKYSTGVSSVSLVTSLCLMLSKPASVSWRSRGMFSVMFDPQ
jgi:hypothetical protein